MGAQCNLIVDSCCDLPSDMLDRPGVELVSFPYTDESGEHLDDLWHVETYFMVDDLEALRRGGRIPKGVAFAGAKLNVKPILTFAEDGRLVVAGAARGRKKGLRALAEKFVERVDIRCPSVVCMGHADCEKDLNRLWDMLPGDGTVLQQVSQPIGPVIGSHVGPGMVSLVFWGRD